MPLTLACHSGWDVYFILMLKSRGICMEEYIEKRNIDGLKEKIQHFLSIIYPLLASLVCGFILSETLMHRRSLLIYILCIILFSFILGIGILYRINKYKNKQDIFCLIILCSFLIYFVFSITFMFIRFSSNIIASSSPVPNLKITFIGELLFIIFNWPIEYLPMIPEELNFMNNLSGGPIWDLLDFLMELIHYKIDHSYLIIGANILFLFDMFIVTIIFTRRFVLYTCPCLTTLNNNDIKEKT